MQIAKHVGGHGCEWDRRHRRLLSCRSLSGGRLLVDRTVDTVVVVGQKQPRRAGEGAQLGKGRRTQAAGPSQVDAPRALGGQNHNQREEVAFGELRATQVNVQVALLRCVAGSGGALKLELANSPATFRLLAHRVRLPRRCSVGRRAVRMRL
jgi:hypothetical protein